MQLSVLRQKKCTMIKSFAMEIISIDRRKKKKTEMSYKSNIVTDVMLTGELDDR